MRLLWFHATNRAEAVDYVRLLNVGLVPPDPPAGEGTRQLELHLSINPARVYCFLGRALEIFGNFCVALEDDGLPDGDISPFDTGGLVRKAKPVCEWEQQQQREYLVAFTFPSNDRANCFTRYPNGEVREYLNQQRPKQSGPHELWDGKPEADVWAQAPEGDWRSWTWEGRWTKVPIANRIAAWSCTPALFAPILEATESISDVSQELLGDFVRKYRRGGVGALVETLRAEQAQ